jgi:UDP-N-acetylmuramoyl-tripeptide--D-alanyl-D-alanine ligase
MQWTLEQVEQATAGKRLYGDPGRRYSTVGIDSRTIAAEALFVAIPGERFDGHTFVTQVVEKGVRGLVIRHDRAADLDHGALQSRGVSCVAVADTVGALGALAGYQRGRFDIPVVAITGSTGKTTTRLMTALVFAQWFETLATQGNLNNEIGLPLTLFQLDAQHRAAVLELGMNHAGEIDRLGAICRPTIGVITNIGPVHLEFFDSVEAIARAKGELMAHVAAGGTMLLNRDDPYSAALAPASLRPVLFYGSADDAAVRAAEIRETEQGVAFELILPNGSTPIQLQTPGRFMVANALAAAAAGHLAGIPPKEIKAGLEAFLPIKGRLKMVKSAKGVNIIDDTYNANPVSMAAALSTLAAVKGNGRAFAVLGDMLELGQKSAMLHRQLGQKAGEYKVERLYAFGPHAAEVVAGAQSAGMSAADVLAGDKSALAEDLTARLAPGDWVLVKGSRGMTMETVVAQLLRWAGGEIS